MLRRAFLNFSGRTSEGLQTLLRWLCIVSAIAFLFYSASHSYGQGLDWCGAYGKTPKQYFAVDDGETIHVHCRVDLSASRMSADEYREACKRVNEIWNPHGIDFSFYFANGCDKNESTKDLHVHLKSGTSSALGYSNAAACNTVRDNGIGPSASCGAVMAHEVGHCFGLDNVEARDRLMGPNAGYPTSKLTDREVAVARQYARRFNVGECRNGVCGLFKKKDDGQITTGGTKPPPIGGNWSDITKKLLEFESLKVKITELEATITNLKLTPGRDGKDGEDGKPGRDGVDGRPGKDADTDAITVALKNFILANAEKFTGPAGTPGPPSTSPGPPGAVGPPGVITVRVVWDDGRLIREIKDAQSGGVVTISASKLFSELK